MSIFSYLFEHFFELLKKNDKELVIYAKYPPLDTLSIVQAFGDELE